MRNTLAVHGGLGDWMIGRESAKAIADAYQASFAGMSQSRGAYGTSSTFVVRTDALYDFLYVNDFAGWILNAVQALKRYERRSLLEFIMRLHTGESLAAGTPEWTWEARSTLGQRFLRDLAEALLKARQKPDFETYGTQKREAVAAMQRQLELDGYVFKDGVLLVPEESVLDEQAEQGVLMHLVTTLGLGAPETVQHHLRLSEEHYSASRWDDSISNSRKVLEAVLQQGAALYSGKQGQPLDQKTLERPVAVRDYMERVGLLDHKEKEAIATTYALLSNAGSHPNIAAQDQARLMRHLALTFSQFVLLRLQNPS